MAIEIEVSKIIHDGTTYIAQDLTLMMVSFTLLAILCLIVYILWVFATYKYRYYEKFLYQKGYDIEYKQWFEERNRG
jgi:uncharacterized membrane protein YqjE